ncbi:MAG TPA: hypothetical protein VGA98_03035 [Allosphingosinicella sp.]
MNDITKFARKPGRVAPRLKPAPTGMSWVARFAGTLDEDFAHGALDQPAREDARAAGHQL